MEGHSGLAILINKW